jgi:hypothetical protein
LGHHCSERNLFCPGYCLGNPLTLGIDLILKGCLPDFA